MRFQVREDRLAGSLPSLGSFACAGTQTDARPAPAADRFRLTDVTEYRPIEATSLRLDIGGPDHLAPLFGFLSDQLAEVSGRTRKHRAAEVSEPRFHVGIGESRIDLLVECVDDLGGRFLGC